MENSFYDLQFPKDRDAKARKRFTPRQVTLLLIAEAPPNTPDRHFYFEDVKKHDSLFPEITGILYPEQKKRYLRSGRDPMLKEGLLDSFREDGYRLIHLSEIACCFLENDDPEQLPSLVDRLKNLITKETPDHSYQDRVV